MAKCEYLQITERNESNFMAKLTRDGVHGMLATIDFEIYCIFISC
jgi:hypothetical protein